MTNSLLTFYIEEQNEDYCPMCQPLGEPEYGTTKMHRSLPTQVHWVRAVAKDLPEDKKYVKLCSDCLYDASKSKEVEAIFKDDKPWIPEQSGMFFIRSFRGGTHDQENTVAIQEVGKENNA